MTETLKAWRERALATLQAAGIPRDEALEDIALHLQLSEGLSRLEQLTQRDTPLSPTLLSSLERFLTRRAQREPLAYLLGSWEFWSLELKVDARVLTPRADTEVLVEEALAWLKRAHPPHASLTPHPTVVDVCAGSGCVGLALLSERPLMMSLIELSEGAMEVLRVNYDSLKHQGLLKAEATLLQGDLLAPLPLSVRPSLIVSNPPYICPSELESLAPEVRDYEPRLALDGGAEGGLALPQRLIEEAYARLTSGGALIMEVGWTQTEEVASRFERQGFEQVWVRRDYGGNPRVVGGLKP